MLIGSVCQWVHSYLKGLLAGFCSKFKQICAPGRSIRCVYQVFVSIHMKMSWQLAVCFH